MTSHRPVIVGTAIAGLWTAWRLASEGRGTVVLTKETLADSASAWAVYSVLLPNGAARARVQAALREAGVPSAIYYPLPLHRQPAYAAHHDGATLPVSDDLSARILALPIHPDAPVTRTCM